MGRINYNCLRGKVRAFAPAPGDNPHLWVILEEGGRQWFATIKIRSNKDAPGDPVGKSYLSPPLPTSAIAIQSRQPSSLGQTACRRSSATAPPARSISSAALFSIRA